MTSISKLCWPHFHIGTVIDSLVLDAIRWACVHCRLQFTSEMQCITASADRNFAHHRLILVAPADFRVFVFGGFVYGVHTSVSVVFGVVSSAVATKGGSHHHTTPFNRHCLLAKETQCCGKLQKIYCLQNFVEEEKHALKSAIWNLTRWGEREKHLKINWASMWGTPPSFSVTRTYCRWTKHPFILTILLKRLEHVKKFITQIKY